FKSAAQRENPISPPIKKAQARRSFFELSTLNIVKKNKTKAEEHKTIIKRLKKFSMIIYAWIWLKMLDIARFPVLCDGLSLSLFLQQKKGKSKKNNHYFFIRY